MKNIIDDSLAYYLSPFVVTRYSEKHKRYMLKNILYNGEWVQFKSLSEVKISNVSLSNNLFITNIEKEKERAYYLLELRYKSEKNCIGYIETTSICPYKCMMCPKSNNEIIRENLEMNILLYKKVINQLHFQNKITLHLFGDPMCDSSIYEKLAYANKCDILPDFSINLISVSLINIERLLKCKINILTISLDSFDFRQMSYIRGEITQKDIDMNFEKLEKLIIINENIKFINLIQIQSIETSIVKSNYEKKMHSFSNYLRVKFINKKYISFPNTDAKVLENETYLQNEEIMFIYNLIGAKLPFRCLKVWKKEEYGITTDGKIVPCCMTYNPGSFLGDINVKTLDEIYLGTEMEIFRRNIFNGNEQINSICDNCIEVSKKKSHVEYDCNEISILSKYCINKW